MWTTGRSLDNWCVRQGVDLEARELFASLTLDEQKRIRLRGTLHRSNPSRCLVGRLREIRPGFIIKTPLVPGMVGVQLQDIAVLIRGEAFRMGGCGTNESGLPAGEWSSILESIANRLVLPLQAQGYKVWVFGDIQADESRLDEVDDRVKRALPDGTPRELRVKPHRGEHQVESFRSTWDVTPVTWQLTMVTAAKYP